MLEVMNGRLFMGRKISSKTIGECVLPSGLKQTLSEFVSKGDLPNMILSGSWCR